MAAAAAIPPAVNAPMRFFAEQPLQEMGRVAAKLREDVAVILRELLALGAVPFSSEEDYSNHPNFKATERINAIIKASGISNRTSLHFVPLQHVLSGFGFKNGSFEVMLWNNQLEELVRRLDGIAEFELVMAAFKDGEMGTLDKYKLLLRWVQEFPEFASVVGPTGTFLVYEASRKPRDSQNSTANMPLLQYLVEECGCDVNQVNIKFSGTPSHIAQYEKNWTVLEYLAQNGCNFNVRNLEGEIPLLLLTNNGTYQVPQSVLATHHHLRQALENQLAQHNAAAGITSPQSPPPPSAAGGGAGGASAHNFGSFTPFSPTAAGAGAASSQHFPSTAASSTTGGDIPQGPRWEYLSPKGNWEDIPPMIGAQLAQAVAGGKKTYSIENSKFGNGLTEFHLDYKMIVRLPTHQVLFVRSRNPPPSDRKVVWQMFDLSTDSWSDLDSEAVKAINHSLKASSLVVNTFREVTTEINGRSACIKLNHMCLSFAGSATRDLRWVLPPLHAPRAWDPILADGEKLIGEGGKIPEDAGEGMVSDEDDTENEGEKGEMDAEGGGLGIWNADQILNPVVRLSDHQTEDTAPVVADVLDNWEQVQPSAPPLEDLDTIQETESTGGQDDVFTPPHPTCPGVTSSLVSAPVVGAAAAAARGQGLQGQQQVQQQQPLPPPIPTPPPPPPPPRILKREYRLPPHDSIRLFLGEHLDDLRERMLHADFNAFPKLRILPPAATAPLLQRAPSAPQQQQQQQHQPGYILQVFGTFAQVDIVKLVVQRWMHIFKTSQQALRASNQAFAAKEAEFVASIRAVRVKASLWSMTKQLWHDFVSELRLTRGRVVTTAKEHIERVLSTHLATAWDFDAPIPNWEQLLSATQTDCEKVLSEGWAEIDALKNVLIVLRDGVLAARVKRTGQSKKQQQQLTRQVMVFMNDNLRGATTNPASNPVLVRNVLPSAEFADVLALHLNYHRILKALADKARSSPPGRILQMIPALLRCANAHANSFSLGLLLYNSSRDLLDKVRDNRVLVVRTGTGSGKSTILPPLLAMEGLGRVCVTQPRRFPCVSVCRRVCSTFGAGIAGYEMADVKANESAPLIYLTDGLLRQFLLFDGKAEKLPYGIVVLDEVHERSVNIDVTIALLARALRQNPNLRVVLCSATMDPAVIRPFEVAVGANKVAKLETQIPRNFPVKEHYRPRVSPMEMVLELVPKLRAEERLLCFLPSEAEVKQHQKVFSELTKLGSSFALYAQQNHNEQEKCIEHGSVFFSTNIAETSLTIPNLRFVVDTGKSTQPSFDTDQGFAKLNQVESSKATIEQRKGRLGRTMEGDYFGLYEQQKPRQDHPLPQFHMVDLLDTDVDLRRAPDAISIASLHSSNLLPSPPLPPMSASIQRRLLELGIVTPQSPNTLSPIGKKILTLPAVGPVQLCVALLSSLEKYQCGHDLIKLCSVFRTLSGATAGIIGKLNAYKSSQNGDIETMLNLFNAALRGRGQAGGAAQFDPRKWASDNSLPPNVGSLLVRSLAAYDRFVKSFDEDAELRQWKGNARRNSPNGWENIAKSLLDGYRHHCFGSLQLFGGNRAYYVNLDGSSAKPEDSSPAAANWNRCGLQGFLSLASTMSVSYAANPRPWLLCLGMIFTPRLQEKLTLSLAGRVEPEWITNSTVERKVEVSASEAAKVGVVSAKIPGVTANVGGNGILTIRGPSGVAALFEAEFFKEISAVESKWKLEFANEKKENIDDFKKHGQVFMPFIFRWKNTKQVSISRSGREFTVKGREGDVNAVKAALDNFRYWFSLCVVYHTKEGGVRPQGSPSLTPAMLSRIGAIARENRTEVDLWNDTRGKDATRETRMSVVAWLLVCKYDAHLEGGFVRDYVIGGPDFCSRPPSNVAMTDWYKPNAALNGRIEPHPDLVPPDMDVQLSYAYFDLDKFKLDLFSYGITIDVVKKDLFRTVLVFDVNAPTGPFTMDLLEPHIVATHDRIDLDVNNLYIAAGFDRELGKRIRLDASGAERPNIKLEETITNIQNKRCFQLRPTDHVMQMRVDKMKGRGWDVVYDDTRQYFPARGDDLSAIFAEEHSSTEDYKFLNDLVRTKLNGTVEKVWRIGAYHQNKLYDAMRIQISLENGGNANEKRLFHGTRDDAVKSIITNGFDDRFAGCGLFGRGLYFADDISKSHDYTSAGGTRTIFLCRVILGKVYNLSMQEREATENTLSKKGHHSLFFDGSGNNLKNEYIVHRYGQAIPYLCVRYRA